jgi:cell wall-associated NlpC family hydrolase
MSDNITPITSIAASGSPQATAPAMPTLPTPVAPPGPLAQAPETQNIINDATNLSTLAQNQLEQNKALTPEQEAKQKELQQKLEALMQQLNECLAKGDIQGAAAIMQEISALVNSAGVELPQVGNPQIPSGNVPGFSGDAPSFYPVAGAPQGTYNGGGAGTSAPADISGIKASLPGGGNEKVVDTALQIASQGLPYVWGGDGPQEGGYDCSGFTHAVYAKNGINIPRTAQTQYDYCKNQGTLFTDINSAKPGDLMFFNNPYPKKTTPIGHVMIYLGNGKMVGAQSDGVKVYDIGSMKNHLVAFGRPH